MYPMNLKWRNGKAYIWFSRGEMPPDGKLASMKQIVGYSVTDPDEAKEIFDVTKKNWHLGKIIELEQGKKTPLDRYRKEYLASRQDKSKDTLRADSLALRSLGHVLGDKVSIQAISAKRIDHFKTVSLARGLKPGAVNNYLRHIRAALNKAVDWGYMKTAPKVKLVKEPKRQPRVLTKDEIDAVNNEAMERDFAMYRIISFSLWTGTRRREIHELKWQDIKGNLCRITGKGDKQRTIPLTPEALVALGKTSDIGFVFEQCHIDNYSKRFKAICREVGIDAKFHNLRHSAASYMIQSGMHPKAVQEILGHVDFRTTEIYIKLHPEFLEQEMGKLRF